MNNHTRKPSFHGPSKHEVARLIAVVTGVIGLFGLALCGVQE